MAFFGLLNSNKDLWMKAAADTPSAARYIKEFLIKDNISIHKFIENQKANKVASWNLEYSLSRLEEDNIHPTPTFMKYLLDLGSRAMDTPDWFYFGYPDVFIWINNNGDKYENEIEMQYQKFAQSLSEEEISLKMFRFLINKYLIYFHKLECAV